MISPAIYRRSNSASVFASSNQFPYREHPQSRLAAVLRNSLGQHNNGPTARPPIVSIISSAPRPRPPMRRRTFLEELELHEDPSYYIEQIQLKPGRTPTADEIIRRRLLGRIKPPNEKSLLPQIRPADVNKKCLIIDLDETLVHSSFKPVKNPDFVIPVEIDGVVHQVYVLKRPYVDEFLARVGDRFECVLFTASLAKYADPVADLLDKRGVFRSRLFREACVYHKGNYVKDLARLGRDLSKTIIIDNSPASYSFHPSNAIPVQTWFDDPTDVELLDILPLLDRLEKVDSVYDALNGDDTRPDNLLERNGINS